MFFASNSEIETILKTLTTNLSLGAKYLYLSDGLDNVIAGFLHDVRWKEKTG